MLFRSQFCGHEQHSDHGSIYAALGGLDHLATHVPSSNSLRREIELWAADDGSADADARERLADHLERAFRWCPISDALKEKHATGDGDLRNLVDQLEARLKVVEKTIWPEKRTSVLKTPEEGT